MITWLSSCYENKSNGFLLMLKKEECIRASPLPMEGERDFSTFSGVPKELGDIGNRFGE